jgi:hypothetical protein
MLLFADFMTFESYFPISRPKPKHPLSLVPIPILKYYLLLKYLQKRIQYRPRVGLQKNNLALHHLQPQKSQQPLKQTTLSRFQYYKTHNFHYFFFSSIRSTATTCAFAKSTTWI